LLLAAPATYLFAVLIQEKDWAWSLVPAAVLALLSVGEFVVADVLIDSRFPRESAEFLERLQQRLAGTSTHDEVRAALSACVESFTGLDKDKVSSTVHLTVNVAEVGTSETVLGLVQISDYTRPDLGGRRWRVLKATQGIVGRCARMGEMVHVNFRDAVDYQRRMVAEFGFTKEETARHTTTARSYLAVPITSAGSLVGVMYFFSTEPQVFPIAADRAELSRAAATVASLFRAAEIL
jgi:hypothetical protein